MIKKLFSFTIIVFFFLVVCSESTKRSTFVVNTTSDLDIVTQSLFRAVTDHPYSITTETILCNNINVRYPQIDGLGDKSREKAINDLIKNDLIETQIEDPINFYKYNNNTNILTLDYKYEITMCTSEILSILYTGHAKIEGGAFPTSNVYAITIDIENVKKLKLIDFTAIDTNFIKKIKQSTNVTNSAVKNGMDKKHLVESIQNELKVDHKQNIIEGLKEEWAYYTFCVTPNSLIVSIAISHVAGDYALIEISR